MSRLAVIDVGSNSLKLLAVSAEEGRGRVLVERLAVTCLSEGLGETGLLAAAAMERSLAALGRMRAEALALGATRLCAVGTMALRRADNAATFLASARDAGIDIEVIPGEEEARLCYLAAQSSVGPGVARLCAFDIGGASTEFTLGSGDRIERRVSLALGSRAVTESHDLAEPVDDESLATLSAALQELLAPLAEFMALDALLVGTGGTVTSLASIALALPSYDPRRTEGYALSASELDEQLHRIAVLDLPGRANLPGLLPERADVILAGVAITRAILARLGRDRLRVAARGLRHGVLLDRFGVVLA